MPGSKSILLDELKKITQPLEIRLIEFSISRGKNGINIRVVIDKEGGVTLNDCERINRLYNDRLTILKLIEDDNYTLQVSSPGMNRVFKDDEEYNLFKSRRVRVILKEPVNETSGDNIIAGVLEGMEGRIVNLSVGGKRVSIPIEKISKTKLDG